jgi:hypothetical protein
MLWVFKDTFNIILIKSLRSLLLVKVTEVNIGDN